MRGAHGEPELEALRRVGSARLWFATGAPAVAWFAALNAGYFFVSWACARQNGEWLLHAIAAVSMALCIAAGLLSLALLRSVGMHGGDERDDRIERIRFLARIGIAGGIIFALIIGVQWIAIAIQDPCMPWPRSRFTPDA